MPLYKSEIPATLGVGDEDKTSAAQRGNTHIVNGKINGKRRREQFDTKKDAELTPNWSWTDLTDPGLIGLILD